MWSQELDSMILMGPSQLEIFSDCVIFTRTDSDRTKGNDFKLKEGRVRLDVGQQFFPQRAVRCWHSCPEKLWCPIPEGTQGQVGWGPGQPELAGWALRPLPAQTILGFYGSVIH